MTNFVAKISRKRLIYAVILTGIVVVIGVLAAGYYFKVQWFRETPNNLSINGNPNTIAFRWSGEKFGSHIEPHSAMLIPIAIKGFPNTFHMQFDTGSASSFLRSGAVKEINRRGGNIELRTDKSGTVLTTFNFVLGGAGAVLSDSPIKNRQANIDWENPDAVNLIGTIGTDLLDQRVCEVDFSTQEIRLHSSRPERLENLGPFSAFDFKGRRIVLPVKIDGDNEHVVWDSGCSAFGLLTSGHFYHRLTDKDSKETAYNANRHGDPVPVHHRESKLKIEFGETAVPIRRVSYVNLYGGAQAVFGRFSRLVGFVGFLGNKPLLDCTVVIDAKSNEFLVARRDGHETKNGSQHRPPAGSNE